jgi:CHRD domain/Calx-beta domain
MVDFSTSDGTASQRKDYEVASGTLSFASGETSKTFSVLIVDNVYVDGNRAFNVMLKNANGATLANPSTATVTIIDNDTANSTSPAAKQFVANLRGADEVPPTNNAVKGNGGVVQLSADEMSAKVSLLFSGLSSAETAAHIHGPAAPGVNAPILFPLPTTNPVTNFVINPTAEQAADLKAGLHYMNVHSTNFPNGEIRGQLLWNPLEEAQFFVNQQYLDFLSRLPDPGGLTFWTNNITQCQTDVQCLRNKRIETSNAIFFEPEYQRTGGYVYRLYRAAFGNQQPLPNPDANNTSLTDAQRAEARKIPSYAAFVADRARVPAGSTLDQELQDLANAFVQRTEFTNKYGTSLTLPDFVDALLLTIKNDLGVDLTSQRSALIALGSRGAVMYRLADDNPGVNPINNTPFVNAEYNRAFVFSEYSAYLRRDSDIGGFLFWLMQVNNGPFKNGDTQHAMVCSFATSAEYQLRVGPVVSRTNAECPQ